MDGGEIRSAVENTDDLQIIAYLVQGGGLRGVVQSVAEFYKQGVTWQTKQFFAHVGHLSFLFE